jgi:hypothetical protein
MDSSLTNMMIRGDVKNFQFSHLKWLSPIVVKNFILEYKKTVLPLGGKGGAIIKFFLL